MLAAIVRQDAHPEDYLFLPDFSKSRNVGFAMKKDEARMKAAINRALLDIEASAEAAKIWDAWFGPGAEQPMKRTSGLRRSINPAADGCARTGPLKSQLNACTMLNMLNIVEPD